MASRRTALIVGVGEGLGAAVARRFAREGFTVTLVARRADALATIAKRIEADGGTVVTLPADVTDAASVDACMKLVRERAGEPDVLVYNAGAFRMGGIAEIPPDDFEAAWRANCHGGFLFARLVLPAMAARKSGTVIFTGATASLRGSARFSALAVGKFGLRALAQSAAREYGPQGVHVAHVVIDGQIDTPQLRARMPDRAAETLLSPDAIAETYWALHMQHPTAWTLELDVRPSVEKF